MKKRERKEQPTYPQKKKTADDLRKESETSSDDAIRQLIIHVGPRKTATTTLQTDLTHLHDQGILQRDKFHYVGRICRPFTTSVGKHVNNCTGDALQRLARAALSECRENQQRICLKPTLSRELNRLVDEEGVKHVILSDESLGKTKWRSPAHYRALRDGLHRPPNKYKWNVTIATGYRRFFEWLPSDMYQDYRLDHGAQKWHEVWPDETIGDVKGRRIELILPDYYKHWYDDHHIHTNWVVSCVNDSFPLRILDLHDERLVNKEESLRAHWFCHTLAPFFPKTCSYAREQDSKGVEAKVLNSQLAALSNTTDDSGKAPSIMHVFYDHLAVEAYDQGWLKGKTAEWTRPKMRKVIQDYARLVRDLKSPLDLLDVAKTCPTPPQKNGIWRETSILERQVFGVKKTRQREAATRKAFEAYQPSLCRVDTKAIWEAWGKDFREKNNI